MFSVRDPLPCYISLINMRKQTVTEGERERERYLISIIPCFKLGTTACETINTLNIDK